MNNHTSFDCTHSITFSVKLQVVFEKFFPVFQKFFCLLFARFANANSAVLNLKSKPKVRRK